MNNTTLLQLAGAGVLLLAGALAHADPCKLTLESNDQMQFNVRELVVPSECAEVEVTLTHSGKLPARSMGHDWVLAKDSDMSGIVNAGLAAGPARGYLPEHDARIIAATPISCRACSRAPNGCSKRTPSGPPRSPCAGSARVSVTGASADARTVGRRTPDLCR